MKIVACINRAGNENHSGWEYPEFPSMEYFLDWLSDDPDRIDGIERVYEFSAGKAWEVDNWEAMAEETVRSNERDRAHERRWSRPHL